MVGLMGELDTILEKHYRREAQLNKIGVTEGELEFLAEAAERIRGGSIYSAVTAPLHTGLVLTVAREKGT